eukprot:CAMPEP_0119376074 /NCGR_PEP_ID=MMETSP1334-20130426/38623_1 /TAXON_ID=127549 /ORGANISM="Calcidiscus leptoporus, Strain RCC1130" /LENGTH=67 /DNA_ID=CAMNT_0007394543 /DNA_START=83 /DNA_END=286 /DNA_ORIENTATION=+
MPIGVQNNPTTCDQDHCSAPVPIRALLRLKVVEMGGTNAMLGAKKAMRCDAMRCEAMRCDVMRCDAV